MSVSLNPGAGPSVGMQSTSARQTPVSGQECGHGKKGGSLLTHKQTTTYSLTTHQQELAQKPRKAMTQKSKGVKTSGSEGAKPGLVPGAGRGRGAVHLLPDSTLKPESVQLPDNSESSDTDEESEEGTLPPSHSLQESKSDQFALYPVIPPQGTSTPGDITTVVTDNAVSAQDPSPVPNSAQLSSSTPVKQEGTAAQPIEVSVEVHVVPDSDQDVADVSKSPLGALSRMSLGTQTGSALRRQRDPSQPPSRDIGESMERHLNLDPARPVAELMGQMRAHLSSTPGLASSGVEVPPFSNNDLTVLEQWIDSVGLTSLPLLQPKQVECSGVRVLIQALQGTVIHLIQSEDDESATSDMYASDSSLPQDHFELDPLNLAQNGPEREEGELSNQSSSPEAMDQNDVLGRDTYLDGVLASDTGVASGRITDFQSEGMDTTAQPSGTGSCSDRPMESQDARYVHGNPNSNWGEGENETAKRRRLYPKVRPYIIHAPARIDDGWYQREDLMDPCEVAPPARRVGRPNVDGSIGGDQGSPLPPNRSSRQYYHNGRELRRQVTYSHAEKNEKGKYPHITEEECLVCVERQDTACKR